MNVDINYAILMTKRLATDLQFLNKQIKPLEPESNDEQRESLVQVRTCINHLDDMFKDFTF